MLLIVVAGRPTSTGQLNTTKVSMHTHTRTHVHSAVQGFYWGTLVVVLLYIVCLYKHFLKR